MTPRALALPILLAGAVHAGMPTSRTSAPPRPAALEVAGWNDQRTAAGRRVGRRIEVTLEPRVVLWSPVHDTTLARAAHTWAEAGKPALLPGPLLRGRVGDTLHVTVRNPMTRTLHVAGLVDRASAHAARDTVHVPPGASRELVIPLRRAGSYWYDGSTTSPADGPTRPSPFPSEPYPLDESMQGAFVVDEANAPADIARRERLFFIHTSGFDPQGGRKLADLLVARGTLPDTRLYVNGSSWPSTERLHYTVGDTVRWRIINAAFLPHPMHLHGFYFRVDARGDFARDTVYPGPGRRMAVTELMEGYTTARLTWTPEREGNWLFHCHLLQHMAPRKAAPRPGVAATGATTHGAHPAAPASTDDPTAHAMSHMAGLVHGIHVAPRPDRARDAGAASSPPARPERTLDLWVTGRDARDGRGAGVGYVVQEGGAAPAADSVRRPGTTIRLTRGEPVAIRVHNTRSTPVAVHWHGMELESRYDGVGYWSGTMRSVTPAIAPGDTFVARFTPPRSGTFIYHTHDESGDELAMGLYGALLVDDAPPTAADGARDHLVVLGSGVPLRRPNVYPVPFVNADTGITPITLVPEVANRLRLVNIADSDIKRVRLVDGTGRVLRWRVVRKDGWTPPTHQRATPRPAELLFGVGETYDVEIAPAHVARAAALLVETRFYPGWQRVRVHDATVPVRRAGSRQGR